MRGFVFGLVVLAAMPAPAQAHGAPSQSTRIDDAASAAAAAAAAAKDAARTAPAMHDHQVHVVRDDRQALAYDYQDVDVDDVTYRGRWTGTWTGHYEGQPTTVYNGAYEGDYAEDEGARQHDSRHHHSKHMAHRGNTVYHSGYGYGWGAPVMTTITFQSMPVVTTTTTTTEEIVYGAAPRVRRPARRVWKPRPKLRCTC